MTVVTLNPNGTSSSSGISVTGAANAHTALSDSDDASYVTFDGLGDALALDFEDLTLPADAVIKQVAGQLRTKYATSSHRIGLELFDVADEDEIIVTWSTLTTHVPLVFTPSSYSYGAGLDSTIDSQVVRIRSTGDGGTCQVARAAVLITYVAKPVTDVTAPSGAVSNTNTPSVIWANTLDADGGAQTKYIVKIYSAAQFGGGGFDPGATIPLATSGVSAGSAASWTPSDPLPDGTYRAYVRAAQAVLGAEHWSDFDYVEFTVTANAPGVPTITAVAEDTEGRIWITLDDTLGATTHKFEIQRSIDAGTTWETIRTTTDGLLTPTSGVGRAYDNEVGNGQTVTYRARALNIITEFTTYSTWASSTPTAWQSSSWWLKSPLHPGLNIPVEIAGMDPLEQEANQGTFPVLARRLPIVVSDVRSGYRGTVRFIFDDQAERADFDDLLDLQEPLLLQAPPSNHWEDLYLMLGGLSRGRGVDKAFVEWTVETLPWTEVDAPTGDIVEWPAFGS